jgi:hypothetical protein
MKRTTVTFSLILVTLSPLFIIVAYYGSLNYSYQDNSLPKTSPIPTSSPAITPTPTHTANPSSVSTTSAFFDGPLGGFGITSPSNKTYNSNTLTLSVTGQVILGSNVELLMTYSLDGQDLLPLPIVTQPSHPGLTFVGVINGSVSLAQLSEGSHDITVFGDLEANGHHLSQATVYFTVNLIYP